MFMDNILSKESTNPTKPKQLRSAATIKSSVVMSELSALTGITKQDIDTLFKAYAAMAINYQLDGYNISVPYIGVLKIIKQYIPASYNKEIVKKYDAVEISEFESKNKFTVLFSPMLKLSPNFRLLITDELPTNMQAHRLQKMPFEQDLKKYNFNACPKLEDDIILEDDTEAILAAI